MKLFIWYSPYRVKYGESLLFAMAESAEQAEMEAMNKVELYRLPLGFKLGKPSKVYDVACAEWHHWEE